MKLNEFIPGQWYYTKHYDRYWRCHSIRRDCYPLYDLIDRGNTFHEQGSSITNNEFWETSNLADIQELRKFLGNDELYNKNVNNYSQIEIY